jgi:hypothetical protein
LTLGGTHLPFAIGQHVEDGPRKTYACWVNSEMGFKPVPDFTPTFNRGRGP